MIRNGDRVYLREDVRAEPLVNGFRAWPDLIPPHTYAGNVIAKHLPSLRAALRNVRQPDDEALGSELRRRLSALTDDRRQLIQLADAIKALDRLLLTEAEGFSLEPLYAKVPEPLRGVVELTYDRYNNPGFRFLEGALYRRPYYDPSLHGVRLERVDPDAPGPPLSAPRLPGPGRLVVPAPFDSDIWDFLGRARRETIRAGDLADRLCTSVGELSPYLTAEPQGRRVTPASANKARAQFLNHACVLIESPRAAILVDPLVAYRQHGQADRISFADLPPLDCLAITHAHLDHFDIETLLQIRHLAGQVIVPKTGAGDMLDPNLRLILNALGFKNVVEVDDFGTYPLPGGCVTALPFLGEHSDLPVRGKSGYGVTLGCKTCVMVADSRCLEPRIYEKARDKLGPVSALFVGMECEGSPMVTANGPYLPDDLHTLQMSRSRRTRASDAAAGLALVRALCPGVAYVYAMGLEPWLSYMFGIPDKARSYSLAQTEKFIQRSVAMGVPARLLCGSQVLELPAME